MLITFHGSPQNPSGPPPILRNQCTVPKDYLKSVAKQITNQTQDIRRKK